MSKRTCFRWHNAFHNGRESCEVEGGLGAPITALTKEIINTGCVIIRMDTHLTVKQLATLLDKSVGSAHTLLNDNLHISRICAR